MIVYLDPRVTAGASPGHRITLRIRPQLSVVPGQTLEVSAFERVRELFAGLNRSGVLGAKSAVGPGGVLGALRRKVIEAEKAAPEMARAAVALLFFADAGCRELCQLY